MGLEHVLDSMRAEPEFESTPGLTTVYRWMAANPEFAENSARARVLSADTYVDAALIEAHTSRMGRIEAVKETKDGTFNESKILDNVPRSQLIYQALMKRAGQLNPKKYGDKLTHSGDPDAPIGITLLTSIPRPKRIE